MTEITDEEAQEAVGGVSLPETMHYIVEQGKKVATVLSDVMEDITGKK